MTKLLVPIFNISVCCLVPFHVRLCQALGVFHCIKDPVLMHSVVEVTKPAAQAASLFKVQYEVFCEYLDVVILGGHTSTPVEISGIVDSRNWRSFLGPWCQNCYPCKSDGKVLHSFSPQHGSQRGKPSGKCCAWIETWLTFSSFAQENFLNLCGKGWMKERESERGERAESEERKKTWANVDA